jgi:glycosyltransferase involved in cell wall biosynthesis
VLVFHGYLLRGTGSNVYNAELAAALVRLGHEVHLVCQERHPEDFEFVGAVGDWDAGELVVSRVGDAPCTVYRPDIGGLLPVYVADRYEGLEARPFSELADAELDAYLEANVSAVEEVASRSRPDGALANHLVMGPAILARALSSTATPYAVVVHGSALEYTVKPYPRFLPYAHEGVAGAQTVLVGSSPVAHSLWEALDDPGVPARTRIGTPGVDVHAFKPRERRTAIGSLRALADEIADEALGDIGSGAPDSTFGRDSASTADALAKLVRAAEAGPIVAFVGKLIVAKGIDLLVASWPLVLQEVPEARLAVIGFGAYREAVERWIDVLDRGDLDAMRELANTGRAAEDGPATRLEFVLSFLDWLESSGERDRYLAAATGIRERLILTGRLEHHELAEVLPLCDALVVPSTFPEAFGMVAVEAAACGALPISARHSGLQEVSQALARDLPEPARELISFPLGPDVVNAIAARVIEWLKASTELRDSTRAALVHTVAKRYSWEGVARGVIAAVAGQLDALEAPAPPAGDRSH